MERKHIVIIGGGFGGTYTARYLKSLVTSGKARITLISRKNYFLFTPLLHEVATGGLSPTSVVEPIREIFRHININFVQAEVLSIDPVTRKVQTTNCSFIYDYLVVSSGAETNYYNTPGAKENTLILKDLADAQQIRKRLIDACESAYLSDDKEERKKILSCAIVGGGATGVELAAEILEFLHDTIFAYYHLTDISKMDIKISLVAASPELLPPFPPALQKIAREELTEKGVHVMTGETVTGVQPGKIMFSDGSFLEAGIIIWAAGVKPSMIEIKGALKEKSGRIKIDEFSRIVGDSPDNSKMFSGIFALGDVSGTEPMLAQVATQQGKNVARNIASSMAGRPLVPFKFFQKGLLVSLGQWYATGRIFGLTMKGPVMWIIWRGVYLFNFHSWRKRFKIAVEWSVNFFYPRDITEV